MKKKFAKLLLTSTLLSGILAGCAAGGNGSGSSSDDVIKIGVNLELSGGVASYGQGIVMVRSCC